MTKTGFLFFALLGVGCHKTAATDSPTNVPVGTVAGETPSGGTEPAPAPISKASGSCGLKATLREVPSNGLVWHKFAIDLKNEGTEPLRLVKPGDGSTEGWRTPSLTYIATANGKEAQPEDIGRCGMMNLFIVDEVFTLNPGETKTLDEWVDPLPFAAGTYDVKVRYKNDPSMGIGGKSSNPNDEVTRAFASTNTCEVTSNAIKVTYEAAKNP